MSLAAIETKALKLSLKERGQLAAKLIASLDQADPKEVEQMWIDEVQRRYRNLLAGKAKLVFLHRFRNTNAYEYLLKA